jgi:thioredoxin reductase
MVRSAMLSMHANNITTATITNLFIENFRTLFIILLLKKKKMKREFIVVALATGMVVYCLLAWFGRRCSPMVQLFQKRAAYEYVIVGAGPAGLQMAYYLKRLGMSYVVLEKSPGVGSFFRKYPVHRNLLSINKIYTGRENSEFNLRHDWNSLLDEGNDPLLMQAYSKAYFPSADDYVRYLNDYYKKHDLNVHFGVLVDRVERDDKKDSFVVASNRSTYRGKRLILATGYQRVKDLKKIVRKSDYTGTVLDYSELTLDKSRFKNKRVLIVGTGNSGFETAEYLNDIAAYIGMYGAVPQFSWQTHYVGNVRAVNSNFIDTYQLKSLNHVLTEKRIETPEDVNKVVNWMKYDFIINCTGWETDYSMFNPQPELEKNGLPALKSTFESTNIPGLYFAGTLMENISGKRSSPSFIHGFRYLVRFLARHLGGKLKFVTLPRADLVPYLVARINSTSGLYQMFEVLTDVIVQEEENSHFTLIEEVPYAYALEHFVRHRPVVFLVQMKYGEGFGGPMTHLKNPDVTYVLGQDRVKGNTAATADRSLFLHPVIEYYRNGTLQETHHMAENVLTEWDDPNIHVQPLERFFSKK